MKLSFHKTFPDNLELIGGLPTNFKLKIWRSMFYDVKMNLKEMCLKFSKLSEQEKDLVDVVNPKIHTFRKDPENVWFAGKTIEAVCEGEYFLPAIKVTRTQKVKIETYQWEGKTTGVITIDGKIIKKSLHDFIALNDGFDSADAFFNYFHEGFTGKLIHWTDLKY